MSSNLSQLHFPWGGLFRIWHFSQTEVVARFTNEYLLSKDLWVSDSVGCDVEELLDNDLLGLWNDSACVLLDLDDRSGMDE